MSSHDRLDRIKNYLQHNKQVQVTEISELLGVSVATARRDLDLLAETGEIQRVHGGARLIQKAPPEHPVLQRRSDQSQEKARIAQAAADLINDGDTVILAGGSTVYQVALQLAQKSDVTVITNSQLVIEALANSPQIQLVCLGGFMRHSELLCYGYFTEKILAEIYADKVIYGVRAISLDVGLTIDFIPELSTDRILLTRGKEIIVVADYTKFNRQTTSLVAPVSAIDKIITDDKAPADTLSSIRASGVEVIVV